MPRLSRVSSFFRGLPRGSSRNSCLKVRMFEKCFSTKVVFFYQKAKYLAICLHFGTCWYLCTWVSSRLVSSSAPQLYTLQARKHAYTCKDVPLMFVPIIWNNRLMIFSLVLSWMVTKGLHNINFSTTNDHTSYLSRTPRIYSCKFFLAGVNFLRFNAKIW